MKASRFPACAYVSELRFAGYRCRVTHPGDEIAAELIPDLLRDHHPAWPTGPLALGASKVPWGPVSTA